MMGEGLNAVELTARGLLRDRVYAIADPETGKVASGFVGWRTQRADNAAADRLAGALATNLKH
jgi:hypothetical protein